MRDLRAPSGTSLGLARPALLLTLTLLLAVGGLEAAYRGRPLVEVLEEMRRGGLEIIFSSAVVRPDLLIKEEPTATDRLLLLDQILAPLGLRAQEGPGGSLLIVPGARRTAPLKGRVLSSARRAPIEGATIRVAGAGASAVTNAGGFFAIDSLFEGNYEVTIEAFGFSSLSLPVVRVGSRPGTPLNVELDNHPAFVTVVVTPSQYSLVRQEQTAAHSLTSEDSALAPAVGNDASRVVQGLPGIAASDNSAAFHSRGSLSQDVSWVLDGLELYDPFHLISFQSPYSLVDTNVVDRIDFSGGGFTADLGDRHGGFVEIDTMVPGQAPAGAVEVGSVNSRIAYSSPMSGPDGSWMFSARGWYPDYFDDTIEIGAGEQFDPYFGDLYGKASFILSPRALLSVHGLYVYDRMTFTEVDEEDVNEVVDVLTRNSYAWLRLLTTPAASWTQETILSSGRIDRSRDGISSAGEQVDVDDDRKVDFYGLKHDSVWQVSHAHVLKGGVDIRRLDARYRYANFLPEDPDESESLALDPDGTSLAVYAAHRVQVTPRLTTELGLRWDRQTYTDDNQLSPRFNAVWQPTDRSEFRAAVGRFSQSQRIHELNIEEGERRFGTAETADQAELSFQYAFRAGPRIRIDAYYRKLTDLRTRYENLFEPIELFPETAEDRVAVSPSEARLRGVELLVRGAPDRPVFWRVSYTLSSADDRIDGDDVPRSWDQPHSGKFLLGLQRQDVWSVALGGAIHSGWPITPVTAEEGLDDEGEIEYEAVPGERNANRYPYYYRLDLQARRAFAVRGGRLWLTLDITNLTNRANACCVNDFIFTPKSDGRVDVRTSFDSWLGRTGSVSILWEFGPGR